MRLKKNIKEFFIRFYTKRLLNKARRPQIGRGFRNSKYIGVIYWFKNSNTQDSVNNFSQIFKKEGKEVCSIAYLDQESKDFNFTALSFKDEDINLKGQILDKNIKKFINTKFDFLYYVGFDINTYIGYLIASSKAKCKVGYHSIENSKYFDIMVDFPHTSEDDIEELIDEMLTYTQILDTKEE